MKKLKTIILAAGKGTRMKSKKPKVLHKILDKEMISYVIDATKKLSAEIILVVGHKSETIKDYVKDVIFVEQKEMLGTGHAVITAKNFIDDDSNILLLYGDTPFIKFETLKKVIKFHEKNNLAVTTVSTILDKPKGYGRIIKKENKFIKIVEEKDAKEEELLIKEINTGIYCFKGKELKFALSKLNNNNKQKEYYITDSIEILIKEGFKIDTMLIPNNEEFYGVNSREQLAYAEKIMRYRINKKHMESGVTIVNPDCTYIGSDVIIEKDTIIYPNVFIGGNTKIGEDCIIGSNTKILSSVIKNNVLIENSILEYSNIDSYTKIGPFAYLRPNSCIGKNSKIGDFVEIKNTKIGDNTKASHLAYLGDAEIGNNINIGCGTITVNYDGKDKYKTIIKDNAFIGCNSNLVAPIIVEKNSYVAAGSTITENVEQSCLAIGRARQINKINWNKKRKIL